MKFTDTLKSLEAKATDGPFSTYVFNNADKLSQIEELQKLVYGTPNATLDLHCVTVEKNGQTLCSALTGCGEDSKANAELIAFLRNHAKEIINLVEAAGNHRCYKAQCQICVSLAALNKDK